jgi:hypothetical protein
MQTTNNNYKHCARVHVTTATQRKRVQAQLRKAGYRGTYYAERGVHWSKYLHATRVGVLLEYGSYCIATHVALGFKKSAAFCAKYGWTE